MDKHILTPSTGLSTPTHVFLNTWRRHIDSVMGALPGWAKYQEDSPIVAVDEELYRLHGERMRQLAVTYRG